jgi:hypothetical protein
MEERRLKINLELHVVGDGRTFINYWNSINGDDVVSEIIEGKIFIEDREVSLNEFINLVKQKFN